MRLYHLTLAIVLVGAAVCGAGEPQKREDPVAIEAPPTPVDGTPRTLRLGRPRGASGVKRRDPKLGGVRAVEMRDGEAVLALPDGTRTVRPGDVISGDIVKSVEPGRVVFSRPDPGSSSSAIVIVRFDAEGRGRVRVYSARDSSPAAPPKPAGE
jgi:hypothetical protein